MFPGAAAFAPTMDPFADLAALRRSYRERIAAAGIEGEPAAQLFASLDAGLTAYTYLAPETD